MPLATRRSAPFNGVGSGTPKLRRRPAHTPTSRGRRRGSPAHFSACVGISSRAKPLKVVTYVSSDVREQERISVVSHFGIFGWCREERIMPSKRIARRMLHDKGPDTR